MIEATAMTSALTSDKPRVGLGRIALGLSVVQITTYLAIFATLNILLPAQIAGAVGESGKEAWLGIITTLAAIVSMVVSPIIGALSDRTRSPLGRRAPWILVGGAAMLVTLNLIGASQLVLALLAGWCLSQVAVNMILMPVNSVLPERVPHARRGLISGVTGFATTFAIALAAFVGAAFVSTPLLGTVVLSVVALGGAVFYVLVAPDASSRDLEVATAGDGAPSMWRTMLDGFQDNNFRWTWVGRLLVFLGYSLFSARMLYYTQAQFGSSVADAATTVATVSAVGGLFMLLGLVISAPLSDRFGRKPFVYLGGTFIALGLLAVSQITSEPQLIAAWAVVSLAFGSFIGVDQALVADVLPHQDEVAKDIGVINLAATIPQTLAPAIGSVVLALSGGAYAVLIGMGAAVALASVFATSRIRGIR